MDALIGLMNAVLVVTALGCALYGGYVFVGTLVTWRRSDLGPFLLVQSAALITVGALMAIIHSR